MLLTDDNAAAPHLPAGTLSGIARRHLVPGAQLAIHHAGLTRVWETGELEIGTGRRVTTDAVFPIGSITKCFTATVAMMLVADGDVDPDGPVTEHVPEVGEPGRALTLRQLLSHTSGLADMPGLDGTTSPTLRRYVASQVRGSNVVLPPGAAFSYSTLGYTLAGRVIEAVTGMPWADAVESLLLRPLGIGAAFTVPPRAGETRRPGATGHSASAATGRVRPVRQSAGPAVAPAGGLALSAADLVRFGVLHLGHGPACLLTEAAASQMRQPVPRTQAYGLADAWGMGFALYRQQAADWAGHDGNADGTSCYLRIAPAGGWVAALTSNANTGAALWRDLQAELARAGVPIDPPRDPSADVPAAPPASAAGRYANGDLACEITADGNGHLHMSMDGGDTMPLTPHADLTFSVADPESAQPLFGGRFVRDPATGRIHGMQAGGRFSRRYPPAPAAPTAGQHLAQGG